MNNYVIYHLHSDLSNGVTNVDSVTKFHEYVERAREIGMTAMAFSEHGSVFEWYHKKCAIEAAGMKYIHAAECYLTETLEEKIRDNYHIVLIAKNYDGFIELNKLISKSFCRKDNHFYYVPRISFDELRSTSDNILITTACIGGVLGKSKPNEDPVADFLFDGSKKSQFRVDFEQYITENRARCYLEIGHHADKRQVLYNQELLELSKATGIPLIAGTDTHALNEEHERGRAILQQSKNIHFDGEEQWDLKFKTLDELVASFQKQNSIPEEAYLQAIDNTNELAERIEPFTIDTSTKYPHIYDNPEKTFREKVYKAIDTHPYALQRHERDVIVSRVESELAVYSATKSIDFMLMQTYLREWEKSQGIECGYGRGSVSGSLIAYLLGITSMDSIKYDLNFFRFLNPSRVTNADIDTDYNGEDRDRVKEFLLKDKMNLPKIRSSEIITFNTIALKGAIRDVVKALYKGKENVNYLKLASEIVDLADENEDKARKKYPDVFQYVDIVNGTIVSIGTHPSGVLVSDLDIDGLIGMCSVSTSDYPVSMLNMKELDEQMFVKLDILGLDNLGVINETCKMVGIERLTPDNIDDTDEKVWQSIRDDTTMIFQWESNSAQQYLKEFMSESTLKSAKEHTPNFSPIKWFSFGNGLLRPGCASFRKNVAQGEFYDNGFDELNTFLAPEAGRIAMQETIMQFLVRFCGYSDAESDNVRRAIAKKKGTEKLLPEIERRFVDFAPQHYNITADKCAEIIKPFIQIILDASAYSFSWNHAIPYSYIGYISGYLRYYYPLEFITASLNIFYDDSEKTAAVTKYASKIGIPILPPKFGESKDVYRCDKERGVIIKGLASIKYMNAKVANELFDLSQNKQYDTFIDLLEDLVTTSIDTRQFDTLVKLDFFSAFGNQRELTRISDMFFDQFKKGEAKSIAREQVDGTPLEPIMKKYARDTTKDGRLAARYTILDIHAIMAECEQVIRDLKLPDLDAIIKARNYAEIMGYVGFISGKQEDRAKLQVVNVYPLKRKKDGKQFGYSVITKSIGSGKESRFTVLNSVFNKAPVKKDDIILCTSYQKEGAYYKMTGYSVISNGNGGKQ